MKQFKFKAFLVGQYVGKNTATDFCDQQFCGIV